MLNVGKCDKCGNCLAYSSVCDGQKTADSNYPDARPHTWSRGPFNVKPVGTCWLVSTTSSATPLIITTSISHGMRSRPSSAW